MDKGADRARIQLTTNLLEAVYDTLLPDETLSSWVSRHPFIQIKLTPDDKFEHDYGVLHIRLPGISASLAAQLRQAARPPDARILHPRRRTWWCLRCIAEDWICGLPLYGRRDWTVEWRTCCVRHGQLFNSRGKPIPSWPYLLQTNPWNGDKINFLNRRFPLPYAINLYGDRRAIHLESALAKNGKSNWFPKGMSVGMLHAVYQLIIRDLVGQFFFEDKDMRGFPTWGPIYKNLNRFTINVMAEAILSEWTETPLPPCASAQRTNLIVRAIGWGRARPVFASLRHVLFAGPSVSTKDWARYEAVLSPAIYDKLKAITNRRERAYFTLPEARQLGLEVERDVEKLIELTRDGQFSTFDARRGHVTQNMGLPNRFKLMPNELARGVCLPAWAYKKNEPVKGAQPLPHDWWSIRLKPRSYLYTTISYARHRMKMWRRRIRFNNII